MNDVSSTTPETEAARLPGDIAPGSPEASAPLIEADDLIEEVSIDGMCGVY
ncbi:mycofactocin precursor MftA [Streptomyces sp. NPDC005799]|uniref:mycofactocin precursor MftA n=1 Tax=Streptomyces sp. NPDC005799 TaxID=3154678 RepID=UPI0033DF9995